MKKSQPPLILIILIAIAVVGFFLIRMNSFNLAESDSVPFIDEFQYETLEESGDESVVSSSEQSTRDQFITDDVKHSISVDEIRQGCPGRDCIPSVDDPKFVSAKEADKLFRTEGFSADEVVGISLSFRGVHRFYPFNMLVTREIVNDTVEGQPIAVTYCPLCGTGIVFNRVYAGETLEFGVSGLLWQSNLLMYNRNDNENEISLWSQVLGEAVLGTHSGAKLAVIPSDIVTFADWQQLHPAGEVLHTGKIGDPYNGEYYSVASSFNPTFEETESPLDPTAYVLGIEINGKFKAYEKSALPVGTTKDSFEGVELRIEKSKEDVVRVYGIGIHEPLSTISGFWFSWKAAHPDTELFNN